MSVGACLCLCIATSPASGADRKEEGSQQQQKLLSARRHLTSRLLTVFRVEAAKGRQLNLPSFLPAYKKTVWQMPSRCEESVSCIHFTGRLFKMQ